METITRSSQTIAIEIPIAFRALDMWSNPANITGQLDAANGKRCLVSICRSEEEVKEYHPDGVYELAIVRAKNHGSSYIADIINGDGTITRIGFQLKWLAGVLVPEDNSSETCFEFEEHPGRFRKLKIRGHYSFNPRDVLKNQVENAVLINSSDCRKNIQRYIPAIIKEADESFYCAEMINIKERPNSPHLYYNNIGGILVPEKNLPVGFSQRYYQ